MSKPMKSKRAARILALLAAAIFTFSAIALTAFATETPPAGTPIDDNTVVVTPSQPPASTQDPGSLGDPGFSDQSVANPNPDTPPSSDTGDGTGGDFTSDPESGLPSGSIPEGSSPDGTVSTPSGGESSLPVDSSSEPENDYVPPDNDDTPPKKPAVVIPPPATVASAPEDSRPPTEFSSGDLDALLSMADPDASSDLDNNGGFLTNSESSSGISNSGNQQSNGGISGLFIGGIIFIILGVGGGCFFVYRQFFMDRELPGEPLKTTPVGGGSGTKSLYGSSLSSGVTSPEQYYDEKGANFDDDYDQYAQYDKSPQAAAAEGSYLRYDEDAYDPDSAYQADRTYDQGGVYEPNADTEDKPVPDEYKPHDFYYDEDAYEPGSAYQADRAYEPGSQFGTGGVYEPNDDTYDVAEPGKFTDIDSGRKRGVDNDGFDWDKFFNENKPKE